MATRGNEIEAQFAHLPTEEQMALLERLIHQMRSGLAHQSGSPMITPSATSADPRFHREWDSVTVDLQAAGSDLLSEV